LFKLFIFKGCDGFNWAEPVVESNTVTTIVKQCSEPTTRDCDLLLLYSDIVYYLDANAHILNQLFNCK